LESVINYKKDVQAKCKEIEEGARSYEELLCREVKGFEEFYIDRDRD
jgi:hypothetical protein